jgi:hypothetical protein
MLDNGVWGDVIGSDVFPTNFDYNPINPALERVEPVGFKSNADITILKDTTVDFTVTADDAMILLFIDGEVLIHLEAPDPDQTRTEVKFLEAGMHDLEIQYSQFSPVLEDDARASFGIRASGEVQIRLINSGAIALMLTGFLTMVTGLKREVKLSKSVIGKDVLIIICVFAYLFIFSNVFLYIFS